MTSEAYKEMTVGLKNSLNQTLSPVTKLKEVQYAICGLKKVLFVE
jgi:hypothetical protein